MMNYEAAAIVLWYQDGNRNQFKDALITSQYFYLDRAHAIVEAAVGDKVLYRHDREAEGSHIHPTCFVRVYPEVEE